MAVRNCLVLFALIASVAHFGDAQDKLEAKPDIRSLHIESNINFRYAHTKVVSNMANKKNHSQEIIFAMVLPKSAFITSFSISIDGKEYKAYLKEKEEAKKEYEAAVSSGITAAHVEQETRDTNQFRISVNVEAEGKVQFTLHYEELLSRTLGAYKHTINLNPGQVVKDMQVDVYITDSSDIINLKVPQLLTSNEISESEAKDNPVAKIFKEDNKTHIQYKPTAEDQEELKEFGYGGQLAISYDVDRSSTNGSQILLNDGYFVHFFAPTNLKPLRKFVVFVLDLSGSMDGKKLEQLKEAMATILDDLNPNDFFNIVHFSDSVTVHNLDSAAENAEFFSEHLPHYLTPEKIPEKRNPPQAYPATKEYIKKAKDVVSKMRVLGGTNIYDALKHSISISKMNLKNIRDKENTTAEENIVEPITIFLTDGEATTGVTSSSKIISMVKELNIPKSSIFSLGFGDGADISFLRKISLSSSAFARSIYEGADATLQLKNFYKEISSPLLSNVNFTYVPDQVMEESLTKKTFPTLFLGSEIVIAGKLSKPDQQFDPAVNALTESGAQRFPIDVLPVDFTLINKTIIDTSTKKINPLERLWAFLTIKQLIDKHDDVVEDETESELSRSVKKSITDLAMKYQFVTPFTSLVVVRPNQTELTKGEKPEKEDIEGFINQSGRRPGFLMSAAILPAAGPSFNFAASWGSASGYPGGGIRPYSLSTPSRTSSFLTRPTFHYAAKSDPTLVESATTELISSDNPELGRIVWMYSINDTIQLPAADGNTTERYAIKQYTSSDVFQPCSVEGSFNGTCKHLIDCVQEAFTQDMNDFLPYFCLIEPNFAGACCPEDNTYETTTVIS